MLEIAEKFQAVDEHPAAHDRYLPAGEAMRRYCVSELALHRWLRDQELGFPRPLLQASEILARQ